MDDQAAADDAGRIKAAFTKALRRPALVPKPSIIRMAVSHLQMIRMLVRDYETRWQTSRTSTAWDQGAKSARKLSAALKAWMMVGGETTVTPPDGRPYRIRPGGVFRGPAHDKLTALADALDAAMPTLERHFAEPKRPTQKKNNPQHKAIIQLADLYADVMCAGSPVKQLPSVDADKPLVRFIADMLCPVGARGMTEAAISQVLRRSKWDGPPDWVRGRQNRAMRIVMPKRVVPGD